CHQYSSGFTF
nr:immunoglobulin light chain junction region [Macaca mulatta]